MLRSVWLALAGEIALGVGIGWTFGWATVSVGELNLLSIVFLLALIGIGMDYLVQILTRYRQEVVRRANAANDLDQPSFARSRSPINTACLGAAGAFLVSMLDPFPRRGATRHHRRRRADPLSARRIHRAARVAHHLALQVRPRRPTARPRPARQWRQAQPHLCPSSGCFCLLAGVPFMQRTQFDPGLLTMQAPNLESVPHGSQAPNLVRRRTVERSLDPLRDCARCRSSDAPTVDSTESILTAYDNLEWLAAHEKELPAVQLDRPDTDRIAGSCHASPQPHQTLAARFSGDDAAEELQTIRRQRSHNPRPSLRHGKPPSSTSFAIHSHPSTPTDLDIAALPPEMRGHFVGADGSFALYIYPKARISGTRPTFATFVKRSNRASTPPARRSHAHRHRAEHLPLHRLHRTIVPSCHDLRADSDPRSCLPRSEKSHRDTRRSQRPGAWACRCWWR